MAQVFTYFYPDGSSQIRTQPKGPLAGPGDVWTRGAYTPPDYPSPVNVRVGKAGIKVWMVVEWLKLCDFNAEEVISRYGGVLHAKDIEAAKWFYLANQGEIDRRIAEELEAV